ncbi:MAG: DUF4988 domain-containing protein, partial [Odoribacteraceae bacterium]|nr:DUF4988 domain-containing protein [Odoribacteraceae bacterium]
MLGSCYKGEIQDLEDRVADVETEVTNLKSITSTLQSAISAGKLITNVTEDATGITVTFSDNTTKLIKHGAKGDQGAKGDPGLQGAKGDDGLQGVQGEKGDAGYTPVVYIDADGYWCVAPTGVKATDNSDRLLDASNNPIPATGPKGEDGQKGDDGQDGDDGDDGEQGPQGEQGKQGE